MARFHLRFRLRPSQPLGVIYALSFLTALGVAIIEPFLALYAETLVPLSYVGLFISLSFVISILANLFGSAIIRRLHEQRSLILGLGMATLALFLMGFVGHIAALVVVFAFYTFAITLVWFNVHLYVKHNSDAQHLSGNEGKLGVFVNLGYVLAPFIGGAVASTFDLPAIFVASALITLIAFIMFLEIKPYDQELVPESKEHFWGSVRNYFADKELGKIFVALFGLRFLYAIWYFLPVLLTDKGLSVAHLGLVYSLSAIPWVLLEYPVGKMADRRGERMFIIIGFAILSLVGFLYGFAPSLPWIIAGLFIGVIGSSFIEQTVFSAFFRRSGDRDVERLSVLRTAMGLGQVLGPLLASLLISLAPLPFLFTFSGLLSLLFLANALSLQRA